MELKKAVSCYHARIQSTIGISQETQAAFDTHSPVYSG